MENVKTLQNGSERDINEPRRRTTSIFGWLAALLTIFGILLGCSWLSLLGDRSIPEQDTLSRLSADYSPWSFIVFQPVDESIIEAIENDRGENVNLAPNDGGDGWYYPTPIPTEKVIANTTPIPSPTAKMTATETPTINASATPTATIPAPTASNTWVPPSNTPLPTKTRRPPNTPVPSGTPTDTPLPSDTPTNTPLPSNTPTSTPAVNTVHIADLDATSAFVNDAETFWEATVNITIHDENHTPIADVSIFGSWTVGGTGNCFTTNASGICTILSGNIKISDTETTYSISNLTPAGKTYNASDNHDPDGCDTAACDSITVSMPIGGASAQQDLTTNAPAPTNSPMSTTTETQTFPHITLREQNERSKPLAWMSIFYIPFIYGGYMILFRVGTKR